MAFSQFTRLKNESAWRKIARASWKAPNDPTVHGTLTVDFTPAEEFLKRLNQDSPTKVTPTHLVTKAVALVLKRFPDLNALIRRGTIYRRNSVDIFLQVALAEGEGTKNNDLSGLKIKDCDRKPLLEIASEVEETCRKVRMGGDPEFRATWNMADHLPPFLLKWGLKIMGLLVYDLGVPSKLFGLPNDPFGSAMVTSVGTLGLPAAFVPLFPPSRSPFLVCVGAVCLKPWVVEGKVEARPLLDLGIAFDHRFMDGVTAALMMKYFREMMENPEKYF